MICGFCPLSKCTKGEDLICDTEDFDVVVVVTSKKRNHSITLTVVEKETRVKSCGITVRI